MFDSGTMPTLERMIQFTGQRHQLIAHNIANLDTPYFKPVDLNPEAFQHQLADAIDRRRNRPNPNKAPLQLRGTDQVRVQRNGQLEFQPEQTNEGILFHDRNNRDLERIMQDMVENTLTHRASVELLKSEFDLLELAIRERL
jgi:flagellar basal-body rod protein FlgB